MALKRHPRVAWQVIDGEAVLIDLDRGRVLGLNASASFLWPRIGERSEDELVQDLAQAFVVDETQARSDVAAFLGLLKERGFVTE